MTMHATTSGCIHAPIAQWLTNHANEMNGSGRLTMYRIGVLQAHNTPKASKTWAQSVQKGDLRGEGAKWSMVMMRNEYARLLKECARAKVLGEGKRVHALLIALRLDSDTFLANTLLHFYARCGHLPHALSLFSKLPKRNVYSWTIVVSACARTRNGEQALRLYRQMLGCGVKPNQVTFIGILKALAGSPQASLEQVRHIHRAVEENGFERDAFVGATLVNSYAKCGSLEDARDVFDGMCERDVVMWNTLISAYAEHSRSEIALALFEKMEMEGVKPDKVTFLIALKACAGLAVLECGKRFHAAIAKSSFGFGFDSDVSVCNTLVDMYVKCGSINDARKLFDRTKGIGDVVSWSAMIVGYAQHGHCKEALALFEEMQWAEEHGVNPNEITFLGVLKACGVARSLKEGKCVHASIEEHGFGDDGSVGSALIDMYVKCGSIEEAKRVFNKMSVSGRNVVSWSAMIEGYAERGHDQECFALFEQMKQEGGTTKPNEVTFVSILKACVNVGSLEQGKLTHASILQNSFEKETFVGNSLIDMYAKCGHMEDAHNAFLAVPLEQRNVVSWSAMIAGYAKNGHAEKALGLFQHMQGQGVKPNEVTFVNTLKACASLAALEKGKQVHACIGMSRNGAHVDGLVGNALVDMYAKCGNLENARRVFNGVLRERDVVSWNVMIAGYAHNGHCEEALSLYEQMQEEGVTPNAVTFTSVLSACAHAGLAEEGYRLFYSMSRDYGIGPSPEHYACMVDLLGRLGRLVEAEELAKKMQVEPDVAVWMALLGACRLHGNLEIGRRAFKLVIELEPESTGAYVLLSNIYAALGRWDEVEKLREEMRGRCERVLQ